MNYQEKNAIDTQKWEDSTFEIDMKFRVPKKMLADILSTAFEGGSNYWLYGAYLTNEEDLRNCPTKDVYISDYILYRGILRLELQEGCAFVSDNPAIVDMYQLDKKGMVYQLDRTQMTLGYEKWVNMVCKRQDKSCATYGWEIPPITMDTIDAGDADSILQYALFGELVFG